MARRGTLSVLCLTLLALVTLGTSVGASVAAKAASTTAARLEGRIHLPQGHNGEPLSTAPVVDASVVLRGEDGRTIKTFCRRDGSFAFSAVPAGSHVLNVFALGFAFPEVRYVGIVCAVTTRPSFCESSRRQGCSSGTKAAPGPVPVAVLVLHVL